MVRISKKLIYLSFYNTGLDNKMRGVVPLCSTRGKNEAGVKCWGVKLLSETWCWWKLTGIQSLDCNCVYLSVFQHHQISQWQRPKDIWQERSGLCFPTALCGIVIKSWLNQKLLLEQHGVSRRTEQQMSDRKGVNDGGSPRERRRNWCNRRSRGGFSFVGWSETILIEQ